MHSRRASIAWLDVFSAATLGTSPVIHSLEPLVFDSRLSRLINDYLYTTMLHESLRKRVKTVLEEKMAEATKREVQAKEAWILAQRETEFLRSLDAIVKDRLNEIPTTQERGDAESEKRDRPSTETQGIVSQDHSVTPLPIANSQFSFHPEGVEAKYELPNCSDSEATAKEERSKEQTSNLDETHHTALKMDPIEGEMSNGSEDAMQSACVSERVEAELRRAEQKIWKAEKEMNRLKEKVKMAKQEIHRAAEEMNR
jgi:hypothetical protein